MAAQESSTSPTPPPEVNPLLRSRHVKFLQRFLLILPETMASMETMRMTIAYFAIYGLDILDGLEDLGPEKKLQLIEWIYSLQVPRSSGSAIRSGFRGSSFMQAKDHSKCLNEKGCSTLKANGGHVAMTYTALASLIILGDDLSRVDRSHIAEGLACLQQPDGSFLASTEEAENDMRFIYCACAVSYMINDWSGIDKNQATSFIVNSLRYDGAFAQCPDMESHGGSTYCAVAALSLMGTLDVLSPAQHDKLVRWCAFRLNVGFQGRPNKPDDTCYSFWVGAALSILCPSKWSQELTLSSGRFVFSTQDPIVGGLAKWPDQTPDPLHTCLGLAGLSLSHSIEGLSPINPALNIGERAATHLSHLHQTSLKPIL